MHDFLNSFVTLLGSDATLNALLAFLYGLVFFQIIDSMVRRPAVRNFPMLAAGAIFLVLGMYFAAHFFHTSERFFGATLVGVLILILPAVLFLYFHNQSSGAEASLQSLERFNQLKDEFLSVASHELRTPLSVINGFAEILVREKLGTLNDEQKRRVRKILMQGQRLNRIVDELLDLSRIRSGKVQVRRDVFDLVPVLKACLDDHQIVCDQQQLELVDQIPDVLPDVVGDLERVTQVVVNLLNNAIKYTEAGGRVTLAVIPSKSRQEVTIEVRDTGIGIDPKDQPRVFEEFFRCAHPAARKYSGSGLGLAIVKQLVEAQGGRVGVFSEGMGKGTTFFFTLKLARPGAERTRLPFSRHTSENGEAIHSENP